jgi:phage FluMu protein Com
MNAIGGFSAPLNGVRPGYPAKMSSHQKQETPRTGLSGTHYMTNVENLAASSANPPVAFERPACPRCKARMMLVSIEPERPGVDLDTFQCAVCNHVLASLAAHEDPMHSQALGRWLLGDLHPPK